jgi:hypothetical protein
MPHTRLQAILDREHRAFVVDHIALAALLLLLGVVITALVR